MGNFGTAVTSLLDTYTKCLSLLKGVHNDDGVAGSSRETRSALSSSLRSHRTQVRRAYASRLSQDGSQFEKGDAPARSALRRIVKRLTNTLANVVRSFHDPKGHPVNCESLLALSHGSSLDAIRTMDDLSSRVGSTASPSSRGSIVSRGRQRSHRHSQKAGTMSGRWPEGRCNRGKTRSEKSASRRRRTSTDRHRQQGSRGRHSPEIKAHHNRVSIVTISSDSTKLGEIRRRLSKQRPTETYEHRVAYPLYAYHVHKEEESIRKKWWNPFRR